MAFPSWLLKYPVIPSDMGITWSYIWISRRMYIYRLKAGGSPELRGTLSLDAIPERSFLYTDGGVGGVGGCNNVMWSALDDVESWKMLFGWKMLLRCKFRCCLQKGGGGWGGVITSCEVRWMMLNPGRCCLVGRCCYVASFEWLACSTHL